MSEEENTPKPPPYVETIMTFAVAEQALEEAQKQLIVDAATCADSPTFKKYSKHGEEAYKHVTKRVKLPKSYNTHKNLLAKALAGSVNLIDADGEALSTSSIRALVREEKDVKIETLDESLDRIRKELERLLITNIITKPSPEHGNLLMIQAILRKYI
jgi:hypothetical protein